jgi:hypothetical protein
MAIELKELVAYPFFEGLGVFAYAREATETRKNAFVFESYGGQVAVDVDESEYLNPPAVGTLYQIVGTARRNNWNGTMSLSATGKRFVSSSASAEHMEEFTQGLRIRGVGKLEAKSSVMVQRKTYSKATLKWQGAIHEFRSLAPEMYQRIPSVGSYVRFELGLLPSEVRNQETGQVQIVYKPSLLGIQLDVLATGSKPSETVSTVNTASAPAPAQAKPAVVAKP